MVKPVQIYVGVVSVAALFALLSPDWNSFFALPPEALVGFAFLTFLGLLSEGAAVRSTLAKGTSTSSITFLPLLACVLLFGPAASILFFLVTGLVAEFFIRRKDSLRAVFNASQYVLCTAFAAWAFTFAGGQAIALELPTTADAVFETQLVPFSVFGITFLALNNVLVLFAITLSSDTPIRATFSELVRRHGSSFVYDLLISPLGILLAFLYWHLGILGLLLSLLPLVFVRHSYISKHRLERANRDLLKALVKAIEIRDPYTMGHSVRVQQLAGRIGALIGMSERKLEELRTAALLHDIGKIEVIYEDILQKPGHLSEKERRIIESHVTRGVEILTSLSSLSPRVIAGVRHHHESVDGTGYPGGLVGRDIPLPARIIRIADAVDAMLSHRPYRPPLTPQAVYRELDAYAGVQFDERIVRMVIDADLVEFHAQDIAISKGAPDPLRQSPWSSPLRLIPS